MHMHMHMHIYIYIYMYIYIYTQTHTYHCPLPPSLGWHHLSNATCLNTASLVLCMFRRVKYQHNSLHYSPLLKKTCVRQVALDK